MANEYPEDGRYKRLSSFIAAAQRHYAKIYEHQPSQRKAHMEAAEQARKDLRSMGTDLDATYADQLPLVPDVPVKKVVNR